MRTYLALCTLLFLTALTTLPCAAQNPEQGAPLEVLPPTLRAYVVRPFVVTPAQHALVIALANDTAVARGLPLAPASPTCRILRDLRASFTTEQRGQLDALATVRQVQDMFRNDAEYQLALRMQERWLLYRYHRHRTAPERAQANRNLAYWDARISELYPRIRALDHATWQLTRSLYNPPLGFFRSSCRGRMCSIDTVSLILMADDANAYCAVH